MNENVRTIFNSDRELSTNSEEFYKDYWTNSESLNPEVFVRNKSRIDHFFSGKIENKKILEIGVGGEGGIIISLCKNNYTAGVDVSDMAIQNCRRMGLNVQKVNLDKQQIPFSDEEFDLVFAFEVFEHFSNPQFALEEIKRVLKPNGKLLISVPAILTYHWPRLFYPELFDKNNFMEFLMANEFIPSFENDWMMRNFYNNFNIPDDAKSWSWYFFSEKVNPTDVNALFQIGKHFWNQKNEYGLKVKPIQALDFFKKCYQLDPDEYEIKLYYSLASLYRAMNGDQEAMAIYNKNMETILSIPVLPDKNKEMEYLKTIFEMTLEFKKMGFNIWGENYIKAVKERIIRIENNHNYFDHLYKLF